MSPHFQKNGKSFRLCPLPWRSVNQWFRCKQHTVIPPVVPSVVFSSARSGSVLGIRNSHPSFLVSMSFLAEHRSQCISSACQLSCWIAFWSSPRKVRIGGRPEIRKRQGGKKKDGTLYEGSEYRKAPEN